MVTVIVRYLTVIGARDQFGLVSRLLRVNADIYCIEIWLSIGGEQLWFHSQN